MLEIPGQVPELPASDSVAFGRPFQNSRHESDHRGPGATCAAVGGTDRGANPKECGVRIPVAHVSEESH